MIGLHSKTGYAVVALALAALAPGSFAADQPLSVIAKVELSVPPAKAWLAIRDFDGWQSWHPAIGSTDIIEGTGNTRGTVRILRTRDGAKFTEELLGHSDKSRTYQYRITDSPLPVANYVSTIEVVPAKGGSTVVWRSSFMVRQGAADDDVRKVIAGIYTAGLDSLKRRFN